MLKLLDTLQLYRRRSIHTMIDVNDIAMEWIGEVNLTLSSAMATINARLVVIGQIRLYTGGHLLHVQMRAICIAALLFCRTL